MSAPFARLVVVDVATLNAAPQIATFFGDLGARVIKVEHPRGDPLRQLADARGAAIQWKLANRNKECVTLDVGAADGRALLDRLLERADVLVSSLPPARLAALDARRGDAPRAPSAARRREPDDLRHDRPVGATAPGSGTLAEAATRPRPSDRRERRAAHAGARSGSAITWACCTASSPRSSACATRDRRRPRGSTSR